MNLLRNNIPVFALLCLLFISCSKENSAESEAANYKVDLALTQKNDDEMSSQILELVNEHRASIDLPILKMDTQYATAYAMNHTLYMIEQEKISHDNFGFRAEGVKYYGGAETVSENVASRYNSAEEVVAAWLKSPSHRGAIEGRYTHTGFGVKKDSNDKYYFTQIFYRK